LRVIFVFWKVNYPSLKILCRKKISQKILNSDPTLGGFIFWVIQPGLGPVSSSEGKSQQLVEILCLL